MSELVGWAHQARLDEVSHPLLNRSLTMSVNNIEPPVFSPLPRKLHNEADQYSSQDPRQFRPLPDFNASGQGWVSLSLHVLGWTNFSTIGSAMPLVIQQASFTKHGRWAMTWHAVPRKYDYDYGFSLDLSMC